MWGCCSRGLPGWKVLIHEHFRIRLASRPYSLQNLEDLHAHLTNTTLGSDGMPAETLSKEVRPEQTLRAGTRRDEVDKSDAQRDC